MTRSETAADSKRIGDHVLGAVEDVVFHDHVGNRRIAGPGADVHADTGRLDVEDVLSNPNVVDRAGRGVNLDQGLVGEAVEDQPKKCYAVGRDHVRTLNRGGSTSVECY